MEKKIESRTHTLLHTIPVALSDNQSYYIQGCDCGYTGEYIYPIYTPLIGIGMSHSSDNPRTPQDTAEFPHGHQTPEEYIRLGRVTDARLPISPNINRVARNRCLFINIDGYFSKCIRGKWVNLFPPHGSMCDILRPIWQKRHVTSNP